MGETGRHSLQRRCLHALTVLLASVLAVLAMVAVGAAVPASADVPALRVRATPLLDGPVVAGDEVDVRVTVANTGAVPLADITVAATPRAFSDCVRDELAALDPGEQRTYRCSGKAPRGAFVQTVSATGTPPDGARVRSSASVEIGGGALAITAAVDGAAAAPGEDVALTFTVDNIGEVDLRAVAVAVAGVDDCVPDGAAATLAAAAQTSASCTIAAPAEPLEVTAAVAATGPDGATVSAEADALTVAPAAVIDAGLDTTMWARNRLVPTTAQSVPFRLRLKNTGSRMVRDIEVASDSGCFDNADAVSDLRSGGSHLLTCDIAVTDHDRDDGWVRMRATVRSARGDSPPLRTRARLVEPSLLVTKDALDDTVREGDRAGFRITVENTGDAPLVAVVVDDIDFPDSDCNRDIGSLDVGAVEDYECSVVADDGDDDDTLVNRVDASGSVRGNRSVEVSDSDRATVPLTEAGRLRVEKVVNDAIATPGQTLTFTITVTNVGELDLTDVIVTDTLIDDCRARYELLEPDEGRTLTCTMTAPLISFTNEVVVSADDGAGRHRVEVDGVTVTVLAGVDDDGDGLPDGSGSTPPGGALANTGLAVPLLASLAGGLMATGGGLLGGAARLARRRLRDADSEQRDVVF